MSDLSYKIYSAKAEDLFWLMELDQMKGFDKMSPKKKIKLLDSFYLKLKLESLSISQNYDFLMIKNILQKNTIEVSTVVGLWNKTFNSYSFFLWQKESEKYEKSLISNKRNNKHEAIVCLKRVCFLKSLVNKESKAVLEEFKKISKVELPKENKKVINKLSDLKNYLKQFELDKHFEAVENMALKKIEVVNDNVFTAILSVHKLYSYQLKEIMSQHGNVMKLVGKLNLDSKRKKVLNDFMKFVVVSESLLADTDNRYYAIQNESHKNILVETQNQIKLSKNIFEKTVFFYKAFSQFSGN